MSEDKIDRDPMGYGIEIKKAERERDIMPILLICMGIAFAWLNGENVWSWEVPSFYRMIGVVGVVVLIREVITIRIMLLRDARSRSR